jgi:hypothetical protein
MMNLKHALLAMIAAGAVAAPLFADDFPAIPATPAPVDELVYAVPFTLEDAYIHAWSQPFPEVTTGYLLVLKVDGDLVVPRQVAEPVLFVGDQTVERLNHGWESGYVIGLLPAVIDPASEDYVDLTQVMMWFGTPDLPEQVTPEKIAAQKSLAKRAGMKPFSPDAVALSREKGGEALQLADKTALLKVAGGLVQEYSPQETYIIESLLGVHPTIEAKPAAKAAQP